MALDTDPQGWVKALAFRLLAFDAVEPGVQGGAVLRGWPGRGARAGSHGGGSGHQPDPQCSAAMPRQAGASGSPPELGGGPLSRAPDTTPGCWESSSAVSPVTTHTGRGALVGSRG